MDRKRPQRVRALKGIGVDQMGNLADSTESGRNGQDLLRLENLDTNIPPLPIVLQITSQSAADDDCNSYLPFTGQNHLRDVVAKHVSRMTGNTVNYMGEKNCVICVGGLSALLNALLTTVEEGDGVLLTDPTYIGFINRVKLAGGVPHLVPFNFQPGAEWKLDRTKLRQIVEDPKAKITTMLLMSPSIPSGAYIEEEDWQLIAELCVKHNILLIWDAAMERLLFDGRKVINPASLPGMADRTITVGSASKELRMIGWRVGWIVGPEAFMSDIATVSMANVVVPVGIAQKATAAALEASYEDLPGYVSELQARRDLIAKELRGLPFGLAAGGWSLLLRAEEFGMTGKELSKALLTEGVCATAMDGWGEQHGSQYIRFVFSNESMERLEGLGEKVKRALKAI